MKERQKSIAGTHYEILRPANKNDLEAAGPSIAKQLRRLPPSGYVTAADLGSRGARRALAWACTNGMAREAKLDDRVMHLASVKFWLAQLNSPGTKNLVAIRGTRRSYAAALGAFSEWLRGKEFPMRQSVTDDGGAEARDYGKSFSDVEDLLRFCEGSGHGALAARRVVRQYMADAAASGHSRSTVMVHRSAIKSYFAAHDVPIDVKMGRGRRGTPDAREDTKMTLPELYKILTAGGMDVMAKAVILIKFQAGLDSSTLADRFNFEAYEQIIRHFGIENYDAWDLDKCPVPLRLVRVKTGMRYTTFIDRDAVSQLRDYLRWKEFRGGGRGGAGPLFVTHLGTPISPDWISARFFKAAVNAGIQKRISRRLYKVHAHEVRDLLKSTLMVSGCAPYVADHVLGHAPRDSYEKQAILYPEMLRREYAKASGLLNVFTSFERHLETAGGRSAGRATGPPPGGDPYRSIEERLQETQAEMRKIAGAMAEMLRIVVPGGSEDGAGTGDRFRQMIKDLEGSGEERR